MMKICTVPLSGSGFKCSFFNSGKCIKRDKCVYQRSENEILLPEKIGDSFVFDFKCKECLNTWSQKALSECSQILAICGSCGDEISYNVVK